MPSSEFQTNFGVQQIDTENSATKLLFTVLLKKSYSNIFLKTYKEMSCTFCNGDRRAVIKLNNSNP